MLRKIWNYICRRCRVLRLGKKHDSLDLDMIAKDFVGQIFPLKSDIEENDNLFEELDKNHFDALAKEVDPLEDTTEISDNSLTGGKAEIPTVGEPGHFMKTDMDVEVNKQDYIKRSDAQIHPDNQPFPPRQNRSVRNRRRS